MGRRVRRDIQLEQRNEGHVEGRLAAAPVDDRGHALDHSPGGSGHFHHFFGGAAGGDHILHHDNALTRPQSEATAHDGSAVSVPLGEQATHTQSSSHFVPDNHASQRRIQDHFWP